MVVQVPRCSNSGEDAVEDDDEEDESGSDSEEEERKAKRKKKKDKNKKHKKKKKVTLLKLSKWVGEDCLESWLFCSCLSWQHSFKFHYNIHGLLRDMSQLAKASSEDDLGSDAASVDLDKDKIDRK